MAGTVTWFKYTANSTRDYAMKGDKQNHVAVGNAAWAGGDSAEGIPGNLRPRQILLEYVASGTAGQGSGVVRRRIVISTQAAYDDIEIGDPFTLPEYQAVAGVGQTTPNVMRTFNVVRKLPEDLKPSPRATDTNETQG